MNNPGQRLDVNRNTALNNLDTLNREDKETMIAESVGQLSPEGKKAVIAESVKQLNPQDKKDAIAESVSQLSPQGRQEIIAQAGLKPPGQQVSDQVWLIIAYGFAIVLVGTFLSIAINMAIIVLRKPVSPVDLTTLLIMFTSAGGFLAGLLVSPPSRNNPSPS